MSRPAREFVRSAVLGAVGFGLPILLMVGFVVLVFLANLAAAFLFARPS